MYLAFTRMRDKSCRRRLRSLLLYLCYVFRALINSLESLFFNVVEKNAFLRSRVPLKCIYIYIYIHKIVTVTKNPLLLGSWMYYLY